MSSQKVCRVPFCLRVLYPDNTSGCCKKHNHAPGYCRCVQCGEPGKGDKRTFYGDPDFVETRNGAPRPSMPDFDTDPPAVICAPLSALVRPTGRVVW